MDGNDPPEPHQAQGEDPSIYQIEDLLSDDLEYIPPSFDESSLSDFESPKAKGENPLRNWTQFQASLHSSRGPSLLPEALLHLSV